jgi:hypothetical protein
MTRRFFLASSTALCVGCTLRRPAADAAESATASATASVRQPALGQSWRYSQHDLYTRSLLSNQVDRIAAVNRTVEIESTSEPAKKHRAAPKPNVAGVREIQNPWGMILVDPHWGEVQFYETVIPLWPEQLRPGWQTRVSTNYMTPRSQEPLSWTQTMKAHAWESITVPAGQFKALRFTNVINFKDGDISRTDSVRRETLWFAPEVGRWVVRESKGSYYEDNSAADQPYNENGFRWELLEWS